MIEFKGECGHTIRAKDDDAGKVVRCSYCGRETQVPEEEDEIDFLLTEVERTGDFDPPKNRRRLRAPKAGSAQAPIKPKSDFNPFGVALKMCYAALIVTVLIVVGKGVYKRVVDPGTKPGASALGSVRDPGPAPSPSPDAGAPAGVGLLATRLNLNASGIYIASVPIGADVYVRDTKNASADSILKDPNIRHKCRAGAPVELGPGSYEVGVSLQLTDPGLMSLPGYGELREALKHQAGKDPPDDKLEKYFVPDGRKRVSLGVLSDQSDVIVMYYDVEVDRNSWTPCTALFLPAQVPISDMMTYLPKEKSFGFDEEAVKGELKFNNVPPEDRTFILDALGQIGMVPYHKDPKSPYQLFWIRLVDGRVSTRVLPPDKRRGG